MVHSISGCWEPPTLFTDWHGVKSAVSLLALSELLWCNLLEKNSLLILDIVRRDVLAKHGFDTSMYLLWHIAVGQQLPAWLPGYLVAKKMCLKRQIKMKGWNLWTTETGFERVVHQLFWVKLINENKKIEVRKTECTI